MKKQLLTLTALTITFLSQCQQPVATQRYGLVEAFQEINKRVKDPRFQTDPAFKAETLRMLYSIKPVNKRPTSGFAQRVYDNMKAIGLKFYDYAKAYGPTIIENVLNSPEAQRAKEAALTELKKGARAGRDYIFGSRAEADKDAYQTEWVRQMYANQQKAAEDGDEEALDRATGKLRDFFDSEQGKEFALKHLDD